MSSEKTEKTPLASAPIGGLMMTYAIPSVVALVVNALYNIVDQIFIGWAWVLLETVRRMLYSPSTWWLWHWHSCLETEARLI